MSALVLVVGALMLAAGGYEMVVGTGDILSERGWSAYIAGSVLVAGGVVTMALGVVVRAVDRLRGERPDKSRQEPASSSLIPAAASPLSARDPMMDQAPTVPILAAPPIEHEAFEETHAPPLEAAALPVIEPEATHATAAAEPVPPDQDWIDRSFAKLERDKELRGPAAAQPSSFHEEPAAAAPVRDHAPPLEFAAEPHAEAAPPHEPHVAPAPHEPEPHEPEPHGFEPHEPEPHAFEPAPDEADTGQATISAREEPVPSSAVIGRYESEGTSYVMYADGSIDAQSEAGVYRFASMAELKTFIES